jgi:hypothetical protein
MKKLMANCTYAWLLVAGTCTYLGGCAPSPVAPSTVAPSTAQVASASDDDIQCHLESVTGSLLKTRVCLTKAQREEQQAETDQTKQVIHNTQAGCQRPNGQPCG